MCSGVGIVVFLLFGGINDRCIKTNHEAKPDMVDSNFVMEQLISGGVSAVLEERSGGLAHSYKYPTFTSEFDYFLRADLDDQQSMMGKAYQVL
jgi:hypothetical protein